MQASFVQGPSQSNVTELHDLSGSIQGYVRNGPAQVDNIQLLSRLQKMAVAGQLDRLENQACVDAYIQPFQATKRNLLMIVDQAPATRVDVCDIYFAGGVQSACGSYETSRWICAQFNQAQGRPCWTPCDDPQMVSQTTKAINAGTWTPFGRNVQYCLSEPATETCSLHVSLPIMLVVMIMNVIKAGVMFALAYGAFRFVQPLLTIGDAISSFIEHQDHVTENMCMLSKTDVVANPGLWPATPKKFVQKSLPFHSAISTRRWFTCITL
jgi:hypothetical protein